MSKLYVFGIGGTGVRVIKALTFLLSAGVTLKGNREVVPIIIDPHAENENLKETQRLLERYERIRDEIGEDQYFFNTKIRTLSSLSENENIPNAFNFKLGGDQHQKFKDFIRFDALSDASQALVKTLFAEEHLNTPMDIGFVGNPHMGSVVLNKFKNSLEFKVFANSFKPNDRVFIVSSIFGGTGAAGFPMLLKNIRRAADTQELTNKELLRNAAIGGLCVQPYFSVDADDESSIQKSDWMIKTKSAFDYYKKAVTNSKDESINAMYYLADNLSKSYKNDPGEEGQRNPAHLIEMIGALSIVNFANTDDSQLKTENGKPIDPYAREFGILNNNRVLSFLDFGEQSRKIIAKPLIKMYMAYKYVKEYLPNSKDQAYMKSSPELNTSFFSEAFYETHLLRYFESLENWLTQMENNERGFKPFHMNSTLPEAINGLSAEKGLFKRKLDDVRFNDYLNDINGKNSYSSSKVKLMDLLSKAGDTIISNYFKSV